MLVLLSLLKVFVEGRKIPRVFSPLNISNEVTKDLKTNVSCCLVFVSRCFTDEYYCLETVVLIETADCWRITWIRYELNLQ